MVNLTQPSLSTSTSIDMDAIRQYATLGPKIDWISGLASNVITGARSLLVKHDVLVEFEEKFLFPRLQKLGNEQPLHGTLDILRIPAEEIGSAEILEILANFPVPIVLEGLAKDSEAVRNWTPRFFQENYGDAKITVDTFTQKNSKQTIPLSQMAAEIQSGSENGSYVQNVSDLFQQYPELEAQLPIDTIRNRYLNGGKLFYIHLFMGGPKTGSIFHCANGVNFFINIHGRKEWKFVNPLHSAWMYGLVNTAAAYGTCAVNFRRSQQEHLNHCPLYAQLPVYKTILNPGDVLINPSWWWHSVKNLTPTTIGCATRWLVPIKSVNPFYTFLSMTWCRPSILRKFFNAWLFKSDPRLNDGISRNNFSKAYELVRKHRARFWGEREAELFHTLNKK